MTSPLQGRNVLLVEDEILIALDLGTALRDAGAEVLTVHSAAAALGRIETLSWGGAVLDFSLGDGDCGQLCNWFLDRNIPFIVHTGAERISSVCHLGTVIEKPAPSEAVVRALEELVVRE